MDFRRKKDRRGKKILVFLYTFFPGTGAWRCFDTATCPLVCHGAEHSSSFQGCCRSGRYQSVPFQTQERTQMKVGQGEPCPCDPALSHQGTSFAAWCSQGQGCGLECWLPSSAFLFSATSPTRCWLPNRAEQLMCFVLFCF